MLSEFRIHKIVVEVTYDFVFISKNAVAEFFESIPITVAFYINSQDNNFV